VPVDLAGCALRDFVCTLEVTFETFAAIDFVTVVALTLAALDEAALDEPALLERGFLEVALVESEGEFAPVVVLSGVDVDVCTTVAA
jgi:hypothetical protein